MRERRSSYNGAAEVWIDGVKCKDLDVRLSGYVDVSEIRTFGGVEYMDGPTSWDGYFVNLSQHDAFELTGKQLDLKLSNGQTGRAVLTDISGLLQGVRETPF